MRAGGVFVVVLVGTARADDTLTVRDGTLVHPGEQPLLELDPVWRPNLALDAPTDTTRAVFSLDAATLVALERTAWSYDNGLIGDGWGATLRVSRNLGPVRVGGSISYQALDTRLGSGSYVDLGISVGRSVRLSRWMTAWIALSLGHRRWNDQPPPGEADATTLMLSVGTTFR